MPRSGPRAVRKCSDEFKLTAVQLSQRPGLQVKSVAAALTIHPFMLSKWRKDARDGRLGGRAPKTLLQVLAHGRGSQKYRRRQVAVALLGADQRRPVFFRSIRIAIRRSSQPERLFKKR
jgi:transposase